MPQLLKMSIIETVGLVDAGANQDSDILIYKRDNGKEGPAPMPTPAEPRIETLLVSDPAKGPLAKLLALVAGKLGVAPAEVDKALASTEPTTPEGGRPPMPTPFDPTTLPEEAQGAWQAMEKRAADAEAAQATLQEKLDTAPPPAEPVKPAEPTAADVLKNADPAVIALVEKAQADAKAAQAQAEAAQATADTVQKAAAQAAMVVVCKADMGNLQGEPEEQATLMLACKAALTPEQFTQLQAMHRAADKAIAEGVLLKSLGADGGDKPTGAYAQIVSKASKLVASGDAPTQAQAIDAVIMAEPGLYQQHLTEQRERA